MTKTAQSRGNAATNRASEADDLNPSKRARRLSRVDHAPTTRRYILRTTDGRIALMLWLRDHIATLNQERLADWLGVSPASVTVWLNGDGRPARSARIALETVCGIAPEAWDTADERAHIAQVRSVNAPKSEAP